MKKAYNKTIVIAANSTGGGKTQITMGLLKLLMNKGYKVSAGKIGPDYIDIDFHRIVGAKGCYNLDNWGMRKQSCDWLLEDIVSGSDYTLIEGVMGLFDGALSGNSSTADFAKTYQLPIILVINARSMGQSIGALVEGYINYDKNLCIAGIIVNRVASVKHKEILQEGLKNCPVSVLGYVYEHTDLQLPARHLGLVQAIEHNTLKERIDKLSYTLSSSIDIEDLMTRMRHVNIVHNKDIYQPVDLFTKARHIAIARDKAFSFLYAHLLKSWEMQKKEISFFSPLRDQSPDKEADAVFLPGGYPELYANEIAQNHHFLGALQELAQNGKTLYGECGGYMVLGESLKDSQGVVHKMSGLLPIQTNFSERKLHLGYRYITNEKPLRSLTQKKHWKGHEFHYSKEEKAEVKNQYAPLFSHVEDTFNQIKCAYGAQKGCVYGSYIHLIDHI